MVNASRRGSCSWFGALLAGVCLLSACGGGDDAGPMPGQGTARPLAYSDPGPAQAQVQVTLAEGNTPGSLRSAVPLGRVSVQEVVAAIAEARVPAIAPVYDVDTFRLTYVTRDSRMQPIVASGLLAVPRKGAGAASPVISYQHATIFRDAQAPSNNPTATEPAVVMASMGYVVIAADYVGYGVSKGAPHPYLLAAPMAAAVVDLLDAGSMHVANVGLPINGQLFLVGYSQGGHATLAAHRALQARGDAIARAVVGSAPGAGPLDVGATLDELLRRVRREVPLLGVLVNPDLLQFLGSSLRRQVREEMLKRLLPSDSDVVFDGRFIDIFLDNDRAAINRESDVHDWRPDQPVRIFHGRDDQTVPFIAGANALQAMQGRGAPDVQMQECTSVPSGHLDCVQPYWQYMLSQMAQVVRGL